MFTTNRSRRSMVAVAMGAMVMVSACASDDAPAAGALDADQTRAALAAACTETATQLDALAPPADAAAQAAWTADVATILDAEADRVRAFVVLDDELRVDVRAFADNTTAQAAAWRQLSELLGSGVDLQTDPQVGELTTEIGELSLGRDDLSDDLGVESCRRA